MTEGSVVMVVLPATTGRVESGRVAAGCAGTRSVELGVASS